ncbi:signal peptidase I [Plantibacter sp. YIM 135347]|uniref:signal peptidase I n=1 Tax=Plantibacter sp. YIM 135347 TaxID=3423919 RepID=UPI003D33EFEE
MSAQTSVSEPPAADATADRTIATVADADADAVPARHAARARAGERVPRWIRLLGTVIAWGVAIVTIGLVVLLVIVPRVTGSTPYTVETGSMTPTYPPGAVVVVRPEPFDQIRVGDVITFQLKSGQPEVVTHRVVAIDVGEGGTLLRTKGDANRTEDAGGVREEQVRGVVWFGVPLVGYATAIGTGFQRYWLAQAIGVGLLGYAAFLVVSAWRGRRKGPVPEPVADPVPEPVEGESSGGGALRQAQ